MPGWLAILLSSLGAVAIIDRLFLPAVRWWLHRPVSRTMDDISQRLKLRIPPFKLARRRALIAQLMCDPEVLKAVEDEAKARDEPTRVSLARARRYAKEIVPAFSAYAYFRVGTRFAKWLSTLRGERPNFSVPALALMEWFANELWRRIRGTWERYGYACVGFGHPVSLRGYLNHRGVDLRALPEEQRFAEIEQLGQCLMREVGHAVPVLPVSLVSTSLLAAGERGLSAPQLDEAVLDLMRRLKSVGAYVLIPSHGQQVGTVGLKMLMQRHLVAKEAGVYRFNGGAAALLAFYANSIAHLLAGP